MSFTASPLVGTKTQFNTLSLSLNSLERESQNLLYCIVTNLNAFGIGWTLRISELVQTLVLGEMLAASVPK
ncbi:hypothetical protein VNO77_42068 [Canavalia gladiata]|uniref:Uncharacterized protein n=1 Tax=Canavalia gladiata TaxID=3824 RepID=A0AAN9PSI4_CANGL